MFFNPENVPLGMVARLLSYNDNKFRFANDWKRSLLTLFNEFAFSSNSCSWFNSLNKFTGRCSSLLLYKMSEFNARKPPEKANVSIRIRLLLDKSTRCRRSKPSNAYGPISVMLFLSNLIRLMSFGKPFGTLERFLFEQSAICAALLQ